MNEYLPSKDADIHPWMPASLHGYDHQHKKFESYQSSPLGRFCKDSNISIHDREKVYDEMKKAEQKLLFPTN